MRKSPAGGQRQRGLELLSTTSIFTECYNRPPPPAPSNPPHLCLWKVSTEEGPNLLHEPTTPTPQSAPVLKPCARKLNQRGASEGFRPLKTLHCLQQASPHHSRSICNTVRGVPHYCPSPVPLCLFCAADRRIQLPRRACKGECSYIKKKRKKERNKIRKEIRLREWVIARHICY